MSDSSTPDIDDDQMECPFCAEIIKKKAKLCRYCRSDLTALSAPTTKKPTPTPTRTTKKATSKRKSSDKKTEEEDAIQYWNRMSGRNSSGELPPEARAKLAAEYKKAELIAIARKEAEAKADADAIIQAKVVAEEKAKADAEARKPVGDAAIVCPYCQKRGQVSTRRVKVKTGFSTAKASFAVVTFGITTLATGLAKKGYITKARCGHCWSHWEY
jgi:hypothetical protein